MASGALLLLAWRNVWRHARRSLITISSIAAGLAAILFGQSLLTTIQHQLVLKATGVFTGHLQVVAEGVEDLKFPDKQIADPDAVAAAARAVPNLAAFARRQLVTGLISSKTESAGILIVGVEPELDRRILTMHRYLTQGSFLSGAGGESYLGDELAEQLGVGLGGEAVLMAAALDGSMGAELVSLTGLYHSASRTFDKAIAYVPLETAQRLLAAEGSVNNFIFTLSDITRLPETKAALQKALAGQPVRVVDWEEVDHELVGVREYQNALLGVILLVVFVIVALGILNTMLMSMFERVREFGVLQALGARPGTLRRMILLESALMGALGLALGLALGGGLILYYGNTGLALPVGDAVGFFMPFDSVLYLRFDWPKHLTAVAVVLATSVLSGLPPALRASRLRPAEALRTL